MDMTGLIRQYNTIYFGAQMQAIIVIPRGDPAVKP
jgi:hypothetical protein